jgi:hypothetical protein
MGRTLSASKKRLVVDQSLTELSLLAKALCPEARVEVTTEHFEDEDGHIRIYPPAGMNEHESAALEERIAERCIDLLVAEGIFICTAVYNWCVHEVAEFVAFLKFRARIGAMPMLDETQLASLYAEFADEDSALAEEGMADYAEGLRQEDAPC